MTTPRDFQKYLGVVADGICGPKTIAAIKFWFQKDVDLEEMYEFNATNKVSARGLHEIIRSEGIRTKAYQDTKGIWTIGIGHTAAAGAPYPKAGMIITADEVKEIFARDIVKYEADVFSVMPSIPQHAFDGAVSFHFNTGAIKRASWVKHYLNGDMIAARKAFMQWRKPPEIIGRRTREAQLIFEGKYST